MTFHDLEERFSRYKPFWIQYLRICDICSPSCDH